MSEWNPDQRAIDEATETWELVSVEETNATLARLTAEINLFLVCREIESQFDGLD